MKIPSPSFLLAALCAAALSTAAFGGQITLKNGDRITGTIVKSDGKTVTIKCAYAGDLNIQMSAVASIVSDEPISVATADGKTVTGPLSTEGAALAVRTSPFKPVSVPLAAVAALRSKSEQALFERRRDADLFELWTGTV